MPTTPPAVSNRPLLSVSVLVALSAAGGASPAVAQQMSYRPVMLSGQQAPGLPAGVVFSAPIGVTYTPMPAISEGGTVLFGARLAGPDVTLDNDTSYWLRHADGTYTMLMREGEPIPGLGESLSYVTRVAMNDSGSIAFRGGFLSSHPAPSVWSYDPDAGYTAFATSGDTPPGVSDDFSFVDLAGNSPTHQSLVIGPSGRTGFIGGYRNDDATEGYGGLWVHRPADGLSALYRGDQPIDGPVPPGGYGGPQQSIAVDPAGRFYFVTELGGPVSVIDYTLRMWDETTGFSTLASDGDVLPNMASYNVAGRFSLLAVTSEPRFAVMIDVKDSRDGSWRPIRGIWLGSSLGLESLVARHNGPIPGFPSGSKFRYPGLFSLNGAGHIAFSSEFRRSDEPEGGLGLWTRTATGSYTLVARDGDPMPLTGGLTFDTLTAGALSNNGELVFSGTAIHPDSTHLTTITVRGTYLATTGNAIIPIGVEGQTIDIDPDPVAADLRTLVDAPPVFNGSRNGGPESGQGVVFNSNGEFVFQAEFDDGSSGVFVATFDPGCPADVNADGLLSPADFNAWIAAFNAQAPECDQNGDFLCNSGDFNAWILNFNAGC